VYYLENGNMRQQLERQVFSKLDGPNFLVLSLLKKVLGIPLIHMLSTAIVSLNGMMALSLMGNLGLQGM
jgi:hypothetical protein